MALTPITLGMTGSNALTAINTAFTEVDSLDAYNEGILLGAGGAQKKAACRVATAAVLPSCKVSVPLLLPPLTTVLVVLFTRTPWPVDVTICAVLARPSSATLGPTMGVTTPLPLS